MRIFDIGANLADEMFKGIYHGRQVHIPDVKNVLRRAQSHGVEKILVTAGSLSEVKECSNLIKEMESEFPGMLGITVGVHPTRVNEFLQNEKGENFHLEELRRLARQRCELGIRAVGEFGLDYDRTQFCSIETQKKFFELQFILAEDTGLPLFFHMRDAAKDFIEIVKRNRHRFVNGVVHSFTGTAEEAKELIDLDLFIGINGCSLKTPQNLETVKTLDLNRIMVESDAPWCEIRPSHAGYSMVQTKPRAIAKEKFDGICNVKSRNEPWASRQVLEIISQLHQIPLDLLSEIIYNNTIKVFGHF